MKILLKRRLSLFYFFFILLFFTQCEFLKFFGIKSKETSKSNATQPFVSKHIKEFEQLKQERQKAQQEKQKLKQKKQELEAIKTPNQEQEERLKCVTEELKNREEQIQQLDKKWEQQLGLYQKELEQMGQKIQAQGEAHGDNVKEMWGEIKQLQNWKEHTQLKEKEQNLQNQLAQIEKKMKNTQEKIEQRKIEQRTNVESFEKNLDNLRKKRDALRGQYHDLPNPNPEEETESEKKVWLEYQQVLKSYDIEKEKFDKMKDSLKSEQLNDPLQLRLKELEKSEKGIKQELEQVTKKLKE